MLENLSDLISATARRLPEAEALRFRNSSLNYGELDAAVSDFASAMLGVGQATMISEYHFLRHFFSRELIGIIM